MLTAENGSRLAPALDREGQPEKAPSRGAEEGEENFEGKSGKGCKNETGEMGTGPALCGSSQA